MSPRKAGYLAIILCLALGYVCFAPSLRAAQATEDSQTVADLFSRLSNQAYQLNVDATEMQSYSLGNLTWDSYSLKAMAMRDDLNKLAKTVSKLLQVRNTASPWQQAAVDRLNPMVSEMAADVQQIIEHLNSERCTGILNPADHRTKLNDNAELASKISVLLVDIVAYGATKENFEALSQKLEIPKR